MIKEKEFKCLDCGKKLTFQGKRETDWYGVLRYYRCRNCKEDLIGRDNKQPELK
jgi:DNA-directed RNA polymerase subunit RPC12/RpoP